MARRLDVIEIREPCRESWEGMVGNDQVRFCDTCRMNVYNLSGMTRDAAEHLVAGHEGRLCVRFYRRADGTVMTEDCGPTRWAKARQAARRAARRSAALVVGLVAAVLGGAGGVGWLGTSGSGASRPDPRKSSVLGSPWAAPARGEHGRSEPTLTRSAPAALQPMMGEPAFEMGDAAVDRVVDPTQLPLGD